MIDRGVSALEVGVAPSHDGLTVVREVAIEDAALDAADHSLSVLLGRLLLPAFPIVRKLIEDAIAVGPLGIVGKRLAVEKRQVVVLELWRKRPNGERRVVAGGGHGSSYGDLPDR